MQILRLRSADRLRELGISGGGPFSRKSWGRHIWMVPQILECGGGTVRAILINHTRQPCLRFHVQILQRETIIGPPAAR